MLKVLIIGLGSIGMRHLRLLSEIDNFDVICFRSGKRKYLPDFHEKYGIEIFESLDRAIDEKPDFAIIANPTALHLETALSLAYAEVPFLIEKPVADRMEGLNELKKVVLGKNLPVMVGFQLRHHPDYKHLVRVVNSGAIGIPLYLHGCVGQYLPDWHPQDDYRQSYSAKKELGGGVILDLCHEIDIANSIFGKVVSVSCVSGKYSDLEIETEDMADIIMEHRNNRISHLHLNYLERGYEWRTRVMGTLGSVIWDYGRGYVEIKRKDGTKTRWTDADCLDRDWLFRTQLKQWLEVLEGKTKSEVDLETGIEVTQVALAARRSSNQKKQIRL